MHCVNWNSDDTRVATASADKTVKIWNVMKGGELMYTLTGHQEIVCSAIWSPVNNYLYSGGIDTFILIWNEKGSQVSIYYQIK